MNPAWKRLTSVALSAGLCVLAASIPAAAQVSGRVTIHGFAPARVAAEQQLEEKFRSIPDAAHAERYLRYLTSQPHMAGTPASRRVAEWLRDQYHSFGFDTEIVTYSAWLPQPREVRLELTKPFHRILSSQEPPVAVDSDTFNKRAVVGFNAYSPSGDVTAPVVYVNYGRPEDYRTLTRLGVNVQGKVVIARYGRVFRGVKAKLAEQHHAAGLILYSDPADDGFAAGDSYPRGPWRPMGGIQRGSILYTQLYAGDPLTPGVAAKPGAKRLAPRDAASLPRIPTLPISARDAARILSHLGGHNVARSWQGALPFTYHTGPGRTVVHLKLVMEYRQRTLYDVIAKLHGTMDDQWVILGNHHDAWVFGAADPGSGTASLLETARALGELARSGWKPRRTIVICAWDGEEFGLIGSTEWVEAHRAELQAKAVGYINTDVGVTGPNFAASATPSLKQLVRDATGQVDDPDTGLSVLEAWRVHAARAERGIPGTARQQPVAKTVGKVPLGDLGSGSDYSPFYDFAGIPAVDVSFTGDYGVYHSLYDDFYWMKHFGDPTFAYHAALARVMGTIALRLDEADILPFDYSAYASEIASAASNLDARAAHRPGDAVILNPVVDASTQFSAAAAQASLALRLLSDTAVDPARAAQIDRTLVLVEQDFLSPEGLAGRPWYRHTIFAPGTDTGYAPEVMPGVTEALDENNPATLRQESAALAAALRRASTRLNDVAKLAQAAALPASSH